MALGRRAGGRPAGILLVDLDSDTYFDFEGLGQFAAALLSQDGTDHPVPPGAAWAQYRARLPVRDRLAAVIAERAGTGAASQPGRSSPRSNTATSPQIGRASVDTRRGCLARLS